MEPPAPPREAFRKKLGGDVVNGHHERDAGVRWNGDRRGVDQVGIQ
jgi:hypothetical protein